MSANDSPADDQSTYDQPAGAQPAGDQPADDQPTADQPTIRLDQFLKAHAVVSTGGQAKLIIQDGQVLVNGEVETRRRKQLHNGDIVQVEDQRLTVEFEIG